MMEKFKKLAALLHASKLTKLIPVLVIAALTATASASVFSYYYASTTATVNTSPKVQLIAGSDVSSSNYPTPTVTISGGGSGATITTGIFLSPALTYYTDLLEINNTDSTTHQVTGVSISGISATHPADFGNITVLYYTAQNSAPTINTAQGYFEITGTTGGSMTHIASSTFPCTIPANGGKNYIEIIAQAGSSATGGDAIQFTIQFTWS